MKPFNSTFQRGLREGIQKGIPYKKKKIKKPRVKDIEFNCKYCGTLVKTKPYYNIHNYCNPKCRKRDQEAYKRYKEFFWDKI